MTTQYARQVLEAMPVWAADHPYAAKEFEAFAEAISRAQKFRLDARDVREHGEFRALPDVMRLPFPFITIEYPTPLRAHEQSDARDSTRKLVLALERDDFIDVFLFLYVDFADTWVPPPIGLRFSNKRELSKPECSNGRLSLISDGLEHAAFSGVQGIERTQYIEATVGECMGILCLLELLACANVRAEVEVPPAKLQRAAAKRKRAPFFAYHVLTVPGHSAAIERAGGGTHASPRWHVRRGHIRRVSERAIWVNACSVGNRKNGVMFKDYDARRVSPVGAA